MGFVQFQHYILLNSIHMCIHIYIYIYVHISTHMSMLILLVE